MIKYFLVLSRVLVPTLILSACAVKVATPTANPVDIQGTMAAAAFTMVAQTQAAIPTATPPPPTATITDTPPPTNTFLPVPATNAALTPASDGSAGNADPCIHQVLPASLQGKTVKMRIDNSTRVTLSLTVYLNQTSPQNQCGYRSYSLTPGQSLVINDLVEGCYTLWAWNPDPKDYFIVTNGTNCLDDSASWVFDVSTSSIKLR